jgi:hypothetical protein
MAFNNQHRRILLYIDFSEKEVMSQNLIETYQQEVNDRHTKANEKSNDKISVQIKEMLSLF